MKTTKTTKSAILGILTAAALAVSPGAMAHTGDDKHQESFADYPLSHAYAHNDIVEVLKLLMSGEDINQLDATDETLLHWAAREGDAKFLAMLISLGADYHARDDKDMTPLHVAARYNATESIELLMLTKADINAKAGKGDFTPLHIAAGEDSAEAINLLIENGVDVDVKAKLDLTPLELAAAKNSPNALRALIENGANLDNAERAIKQAEKRNSEEALDILKSAMNSDDFENYSVPEFGNNHFPKFEEISPAELEKRKNYCAKINSQNEAALNAEISDDSSLSLVTCKLVISLELFKQYSICLYKSNVTTTGEAEDAVKQANERIPMAQEAHEQVSTAEGIQECEAIKRKFL